MKLLFITVLLALGVTALAKDTQVKKDALKDAHLQNKIQDRLDKWEDQRDKRDKPKKPKK